MASEHEISARMLDVLEFLAKVAGSLGVVAAFVKGVWQPCRKWRQESLGKAIRAALAPELSAIAGIVTADEQCAEGLRAVTKRVGELAGDLDLFLELARDNRERQDEVAELLDAVGFSTDRRLSPERRVRGEEILNALIERRLAARRRIEREALNPNSSEHTPEPRNPD